MMQTTMKCWRLRGSQHFVLLCCTACMLVLLLHTSTVTHRTMREFFTLSNFKTMECLQANNIFSAKTTPSVSPVSETINGTKRLCSGYNTSNIILCQLFYGRLGNCMFTYASNFCLRKKCGFRLPIPNDLEIYRIFNLTAEPMNFWKLQGVCKKSEHHIGFFVGQFIYENFNISCTRDFSVNGLLQSYLNFIDCEEDIRKEFKFRQSLEEVAERTISEIINKVFHFDLTSRNFTLVAIHVRRGDYLTSQFQYPVANEHFYDKARDYFRTRYQNVTFVVLTTPENNTRKWCMDNLVKTTTDTYLAPDGSTDVHMYILANSDHVIISSGTFGWWGAWLNRNATVVKWNALYNTSYWNSSDYYPSDWIKMGGQGLGKSIDSRIWLGH